MDRAERRRITKQRKLRIAKFIWRQLKDFDTLLARYYNDKVIGRKARTREMPFPWWDKRPKRRDAGPHPNELRRMPIDTDTGV